jgi:hypothetical protein
MFCFTVASMKCSMDARGVVMSETAKGFHTHAQEAPSEAHNRAEPWICTIDMD